MQKINNLIGKDYSNEFYNLYINYLKEPTVRSAHDWIFNILLSDRAFQNVIDLGCGQHCEFLTYFQPCSYVGIDLNIDESDDEISLIRADYRKLSVQKLQQFQETAFVSLFSSEITAPPDINYSHLYNKLFRYCPNIQSGLVSGFYYLNKLNENPVGEAGGIISYQTLEPLHAINATLFSERRIIMPVPSKLFGSDVYEVWKFFKKR